jgi:hypothetical protein
MRQQAGGVSKSSPARASRLHLKVILWLSQLLLIMFLITKTRRET